MNKYLILDDGDNIKSYSEEEKKYVVVGTSPVTKEMFELYGNDRVYNREGLVLENPTLLYYTQNDVDLNYKLIGVPLPQMLKLKQSFHITEKGVKSITTTHNLSSGADIKFIIYNGNGHFGLSDTGIWTEVDIDNMSQCLKYGISVRKIGTITESQFKKLFVSGNQSFSFCCILEQTNSSDICEIQKIKIQYLY